MSECTRECVCLSVCTGGSEYMRVMCVCIFYIRECIVVGCLVFMFVCVCI